jgi:hypothetical protein
MDAIEIAWANASVLQHRLACSALANFSVFGTNCGVQGLGTNPVVLGSAGGDVASGYVLQERGRSDVYLTTYTYIPIYLTTYTRSIEKGRVNPSPGGWVGGIILCELFPLVSWKVMR